VISYSLTPKLLVIFPKINANTPFATVAEEEAPAGMLYRGTYDAFSRFMDDDKNEHLSFNWTFEIKKSWD
jgi:hypothetical protein